MEGKTCVVTGATGGIGRAAAQALVAAGARVVLVGRDEARCVRVAESLTGSGSGAQVDYEVADLSAQADVRSLAARLLERCPRIDVLLNNAGAFFHERTETVDGIERTFALNHLAYFLLTCLLRERLVETGAARVVNVASRAHRGVTLDFDDLGGAHRYRGWRAYRASKLANILFTFELAERLRGTGVTANCLHPGLVSTGFALNNGPLVRIPAKVAMWLGGISPEEGARTAVFLACDPSVAEVSGRYFHRCVAVEPSPAARDVQARRRLWAVSEEMVKLPGG